MSARRTVCILRIPSWGQTFVISPKPLLYRVPIPRRRFFFLQKVQLKFECCPAISDFSAFVAYVDNFLSAHSCCVIPSSQAAVQKLFFFKPLGLQRNQCRSRSNWAYLIWIYTGRKHPKISFPVERSEFYRIFCLQITYFCSFYPTCKACLSFYLLLTFTTCQKNTSSLTHWFR